MSSPNGIGGGRGGVPNVVSLQNRDLQRNPATAVIRSVTWEKKEAVSGSPVGFTITLVKSPTVKIAQVEIVFTSNIGQPVSMRLPAINIMGFVIKGLWQSKALSNVDPSQGSFTLKVRVDNDSLASDALKLTEHPAARAARLNSTDRFG